MLWNTYPDFVCAVSEITDSIDIQNTVYEFMTGYIKVR